MKRKAFLFLLGYFILILIVSISSCKHDIIIPSDYGYKGPCHCPSDSTPVITTPCNSDTVYFRNVILPLIQSSCAMSGCHDVNTTGEIRPLVSYTTIMGYVVGGSSSSSELYRKLLETNPQDRMPPAPYSALTQEQINLIKKWIDQGAKDNYCSSCDTTAFKFGLNIWPIFRDNCMGCHSGTAPQKGLLLTDYAHVKVIVDNGKLINALNATNGFKQMPPTGKLISCKIVQINKWIANGAPND